MIFLARCCLVLAATVGANALTLSGKTGIPGGPEEVALFVHEAGDVNLQVEQLEGGGMLIGEGSTPAAPAATGLLMQLMVPILSLAAGICVWVFLPQYKTLSQLLLFFGAQAFMNLYMKAILSNSVVSKELHMKGFQAPLVLTAMQQLVGFICLLAMVLGSQLTPWAYKPRPLESKQQVIAVLVLAVTFTMNIALNNFSLALLDMSVNVMIRSASPMTSLIFQLLFRRWFKDQNVDVSPPKVAFMMLGVICALLVVVAKHSGSAGGEHGASGLGLILCIISLIFSSMELIVVVILGDGFKLNPIDTLLYMALPVFCLLLMPSFFIKHPVAYPGHQPATDWSVLVEVARLNPGTVVLVMLSGIWALGYNLLLYNMVRGLSPYFASFAANFNKVAAIGLALMMGLEALPHGGWKCLMIFGVLGNMASFSAYSMWPNRPVEKDSSAIKQELILDKAGCLMAQRAAADPEAK